MRRGFNARIFVRLALVIIGCFGTLVVVNYAVSHGPAFEHTDQPAEAYATVDDVYAALAGQMDGATPDFETQVKPVLDMHLTYGELQQYVQLVQPPEPSPAVSSVPTTPPTAKPTATAAVRTSIPATATSYFYANWNCGTSAQCATVMGTSVGSAGPFCTKPPCDIWRQRNFAGATCDTAARYRIYRGPTPPSPCQG